MFTRSTKIAAAVGGGALAIAVAAGALANANTGEDKAPAKATTSQSQVTKSNPAPKADDAAQSALAAVTYLEECVEGNNVQQPATYTIACGDAKAQLVDLKWTGWGTDAATATGTAQITDAGKTEKFAVKVTADKLIKGEGAAHYGSLTVDFTNGHPEGFEKSEVIDLAGNDAPIDAMGGDARSESVRTIARTVGGLGCVPTLQLPSAERCSS